MSDDERSYLETKRMERYGIAATHAAMNEALKSIQPLTASGSSVRT